MPQSHSSRRILVTVGLLFALLLRAGAVVACLPLEADGFPTASEALQSSQADEALSAATPDDEPVSLHCPHCGCHGALALDGVVHEAEEARTTTGRTPWIAFQPERTPTRHHRPPIL